jgi:hypothetical protein
MKLFISFILLFVQLDSYGQKHKLKGLWINTQYKVFKDEKNESLAMHCTPQYIDIDSLGNAIVINDFEHYLKLGLPKRKVKYGTVTQFIYKRNQTYYITEIRLNDNFISLEIDQNGLSMLFVKMKREYETEP